jgi:hypothetical protein
MLGFAGVFPEYSFSLLHEEAARRSKAALLSFLVHHPHHHFASLVQSVLIEIELCPPPSISQFLIRLQFMAEFVETVEVSIEIGLFGVSQVITVDHLVVKGAEAAVSAIVIESTQEG